MSAFPALLPLLTRKQASHLGIFGISQPASNVAATMLFLVSVQVPPPPVPSNTNPATTRLAPSAPLRVSQSVESGVLCPCIYIFPNITPCLCRAGQNLQTSVNASCTPPRPPHPFNRILAAGVDRWVRGNFTLLLFDSDG